MRREELEAPLGDDADFRAAFGRDGKT